MVRGIDMDKKVTSKIYDKHVNKYKVKCGSTLEDWESRNWITEQDPMDGFNGIVVIIRKKN